jgi:hypothetical protein
MRAADARRQVAMTAPSWKDKWRRIESKFQSCTAECITNYRSDDKCRDSLEAVFADIWNLKDWLLNDPAAGVNTAEIHSFLNSVGAFNLRACGDLETHHKHYRVDDPRREHTRIEWKGIHNHPSGFPIVFSVTRTYKDNPRNTDTWEDAYELARRAINTSKGLLQ